MRKIKILLVDDHPVVRQGIAACLARNPDFVIAGEAGDGAEAVRKARELLPDIILMDIGLPGMDGLEATKTLRIELPRTRIVIISTDHYPELMSRVVRSGARGYVLKQDDPEDLVRAVEMVYAGEVFFSRVVAKAALNQFAGLANNGAEKPLTSRENEVLVAVAGGFGNKEIASRLGVGVRTVETHRERIMRKLNIHSIAGLTKYAVSKGLIKLGEGGRSVEAVDEGRGVKTESRERGSGSNPRSGKPGVRFSGADDPP